MMKDIERVADDLYLIKQPFHDHLTGVVVILGSKSIGVVDTGLETTPTEYLFPFLSDLGRKPEEITYVVNTHRDGDHIGGIRRLRKKRMRRSRFMSSMPRLLER